MSLEQRLWNRSIFARCGVDTHSWQLAQMPQTNLQRVKVPAAGLQNNSLATVPISSALHLAAGADVSVVTLEVFDLRR